MASPNWGRQATKPKEAKKRSKVLDKLSNMSMGELREFVKENKLKAKDTSKEELLDEIIKELKEKGEV